MADNIQFKIDAVLSDNSASNLQQQIDNLQNNTSLKLSIQNQNALNSIQKVQDKIDTLRNSMSGMNITINTNGFDDVGNKTDEITHKIKKMYGEMKPSDIAQRLGIQEYDSLDQKVQELANNMSKITSKTITTDGLGNITGAILQYKDEIGNVTTETLKWQTVGTQTVDGIETQTQKLVTTQMKYQDKIEQIEKAEQRRQQALNNLGTDTGTLFKTNGVKDIESLNTALSGTLKGWDNNIKNITDFKQSVDSAGNTITKFTVREKEIGKGVDQWKETSYAVSTADNKLRMYKQTQSDVLNTQQSLGQMLSSALERSLVWGTSIQIINGCKEAVGDCVQYVEDLDKALTDIQTVTMYTDSQMQSLANTYNEIAQNLGRTTLEVTDSAVEWLRQGYSVADTNTLIADSMKLSTLGDMDSADATKALTSAMKGYKIEADDMIGVVDKLVTVDMQAATSSSDLATALARCANIARTSGVDIDQALGMIATTAEVTQQSAEVIGNAFKTIFSRMQNIKTQNLIDPETGESLNDVETTLNGMGIKLRENENTWRNFGDVLDEVAGKWQNFSDTQKSALATAFAGKQCRVPEHIVIYGVAV